MSDLQDGLKKIGIFAGKQIAKSAQNIVGSVKDSVKNSDRKKQILDKIYAPNLKKFARLRGIYPETFFDDEPTIDDWKDAIAENVSLEELIAFAKKNSINIRDVTDGIDEDKTRKDQKELEEDGGKSDEIKQVAKCIREFKPAGNGLNEAQFQVQLFQYLKRDFPQAEMESQRGSSRPDIEVNGIAIEIKGPTRDAELQTIADKLLRYPNRFPKGFIIVLFDVSVSSYRYEEWLRSVNEKYPNVEVIKNNQSYELPSSINQSMKNRQPSKPQQPRIQPKLKSDVSVCPQCGGSLVERTGARGKFYGCNNFPRCRYTR